jgi:hypothetical protein
VVTLNGRDTLLGRHGTVVCKVEYRRRIAEWLANGRRFTHDQVDLTICELIAAFKTYAESYYRLPNGSRSDEVNNFNAAPRPLRILYGNTRARTFGPLALQAVRNEMIRFGWCRNYINHKVARIKIVFKWAGSQELIPASIHQALTTVSGLRRGRSDAVESDPVETVSEKIVEAALPHLSSVVAAMVRLQRLTGARPGEICKCEQQKLMCRLPCGSIGTAPSVVNANLPRMICRRLTCLVTSNFLHSQIATQQSVSAADE